MGQVIVHQIRLTTLRDMQRIETAPNRLCTCLPWLTTLRDMQRIETLEEQLHALAVRLTTLRDMQRIETGRW